MSDTIWELLLIFVAYAVLGWAGTVAADAFRTGRFINAGTLNGPVNLTCGVVLTLTATLSDRYATNFVGLFLLTAMVITAAGPIGGFLSERVLGRKLWDYASGEYNTFNSWRGLTRTLISTALVLIVVLFLHPYLYIAIQLIPLTALRVVDIVLLAVLGLDLLATFAAMRTIRRRESRRLREVSASLQDMRMTWGSRLVSAIRRRLWKAFPELEDEPNRGDGFGRPAEGRVFARGLCIHKLFWVFLICALLGDWIETVYVWATAGVLMSRSSLLYGTFMALGYLGGGLWVILAHWESIPGALVSVWEGALGREAVLGGGAAAALQYGLARGVCTNEAGLGSTALVHCASGNDDPAQEGMWGIFEVFCSTLVVCTVTALAILTSGVLETESVTGVVLTAAAFSTVMGDWGGGFVAVCLALFGFSTLLGWSWYGECGLRSLTGGRGLRVYRLLFLALIVLGSVLELRPVWQLSDIFNALMAWPSLIALLLWRREVLRAFHASS